MGEALKKRLKMKKDIPAREELSLNLKVASNLLSNRMDKVIVKYGITGSQYNVLRILKGVYPEGHPRCEIAPRMIDIAPDITRLIDRLEKQGLVTRDRTKADRRMSITKLTEKGLKLVEEIKPIMDNEHKNSTKSLTEEECKKLSLLLEKLYRNNG
jgi:DNA-binding MarR family transcriptional regulator